MFDKICVALSKISEILKAIFQHIFNNMRPCYLIWQSIFSGNEDFLEMVWSSKQVNMTYL